MKKRVDIYLSDKCGACIKFEEKINMFLSDNKNKEKFNVNIYKVKKEKGYTLNGKRINIPGIPAVYVDGKLLIGDRSLELINE